MSLGAWSCVPTNNRATRLGLPWFAMERERGLV